MLLSFAALVTPHIELEIVKRDPDDNRILECAQASHSDYLVTGDNHLLELKQYAACRILKPAEFLELVLKQEHWAII